MRLLDKFSLRLHSLFRRESANTDLDSELRFHLEREVATNVAAGMTPEDARAAALREFGGIDQIREECSDMRNVSWLQDFAQDLRYGIRTLAKSPGFAAVAIATLALGIGANTVIFSFIDAVLLRSLPVNDPQELVLFRWSAHQEPKGHGFSGYDDCSSDTSPTGNCSFSVPFFQTLRAQADAFSGMTAFAGPMNVDLSGNGAASIASGLYVSDDFFSTLGVRTFVGRPLTLADDTPSASPAIVLNYAYWVRAFGADPSAVGRTVRLDNTVATIVGVADAHFTNLTPGKMQDFYMPLSLSDTVRGEWWRNQDRLSDPGIWWVVMLGRLKAGFSLGQAQATATTIFRNEMLYGAAPAFKAGDSPTISLLPAQSGLNGETSRTAPMLILMMIVVGFVLLIACANIAGLTLARSAARQKEMALRLALGAGRMRLIRQLLTESLFLALAGGGLGVFLSVWRIGAITNMVSGDSGEPFPFVVAPDWRVLTFTIAATFATAILFGLAPALRGSRIDLTPSLKESASSFPGGGYTGRTFRLGDALVIAQVALSIVVLIGAGLLVRTLRNLRDIKPGFDAQNILLFGIDPTIAGYTDEQTQQLYSNLQQRFAALPGVISASYSEDALLSGGESGNDVHLDDAPPQQDVNTGAPAVGLNFFATMRIPVLAGRGFTSGDFAAASATRAAQKALQTANAKKDSAAPSGSGSAARALFASAQKAYSNSAPIPVLINETFARKYLPKQNPIGLHMGDPQTSDDEVQHPGPGYTIIGIVGDTKYGHLQRSIKPMMFLPLVSNEAHFELRTASSPTALVKSVREIVSQADDNLPLTEVRTQAEQIEHQLLQQRLLARLSGFFGLIALVLACIGLYGLLSYEVSRRTREIGIRMALGAKARDVLRMVIAQGIVLAAVGVAIGVAIAFGITRFLESKSLLYNVKPTDPFTFVGVALLLCAVAVFACYVPARRATRVDPLVALRYE